MFPNFPSTCKWVVFAAALLGLACLFGPAPEQVAAQGGPQRYIVQLRPQAGDSGQAAASLGRRYGFQARRVYRHALRGFAATMTPQAAANLGRHPSVLRLEADQVVHIVGKNGKGGKGGGGGGKPKPSQPPQVTPTGVSRIGGSADPDVNVNIAIIDTGSGPHVDLNVVGGVNFSTGRPNKYADRNGHGSHVAGTAAAINNAFGVVGVAPGAPLWSVRVLDKNGSGFTSDVIAGVDWVAARAEAIKVANMSLGGARNSLLDQAVQNAVAAGVVIVVAAGNSSEDVSLESPAGEPSAITVSALADNDGQPGGLGGVFTLAGSFSTERDDTFAFFSNFGTGVDIMAPGANILSTWLSDGYNTISGTSMSSPHVAGAAALYIETHPGATPAEVTTALRNAAAAGHVPDDPDGVDEGVLNVASF